MPQAKRHTTTSADAMPRGYTKILKRSDIKLKDLLFNREKLRKYDELKDIKVICGLAYRSS